LECLSRSKTISKTGLRQHRPELHRLAENAETNLAMCEMRSQREAIWSSTDDDDIRPGHGERAFEAADGGIKDVPDLANRNRGNAFRPKKISDVA